MKYLIKNGNLVLENKILHNHTLVVSNYIITDIIESSGVKLSTYDDYEIIDADNGFVTPGLIEMHIHGCGPYDFASMPAESYEKAETILQTRGINTFVPTFQAHLSTTLPFVHWYRHWH
ncbi:MAG: hypothetical protein KAR21_17405 [Spirochaetales bacterium]|nr:hypothetical protein [Spirochaetales bacterium]